MKKYFALLLLLLAIFAFVGCKKGKPDIAFEIVKRTPTLFTSNLTVYLPDKDISDEKLIELSDYLIQEYEEKKMYRGIGVQFFSNKDAAEYDTANFNNISKLSELTPTSFFDEKKYEEERLKYNAEVERQNAQAENYNNNFFAELLKNPMGNDNDQNNLLQRKADGKFVTIKKY